MDYNNFYKIRVKKKNKRLIYRHYTSVANFGERK